MPNYQRDHVPGGSFFFTLVTDGRRRFLTNPDARVLLGSVIRECKRDRPFRINAIVLLPDHLHAIWTLPHGDSGYSARWGWVKKEFTKRWLAEGGSETVVSEGRQHGGCREVRQPRLSTVPEYSMYAGWWSKLWFASAARTQDES